MEIKELYISPEVEIMCFQPVESLASFLTGTWNWGSGDLGDDDEFNDLTSPGTGEGGEDDDFEGEP